MNIDVEIADLYSLKTSTDWMKSAAGVDRLVWRLAVPEYWECLALPGVRLDSQGDDDIRQKVARGHFLACLFDWWRHNSIKNVSVGFNVLTLLPIIGVLSVGFSIMSLIVIISLLTSLLLRYIADWDDKRVVLSNIFWGKWIRICKISNKHFSGDINIPV